jgi:UDP-glucose 4-epimerase
MKILITGGLGFVGINLVRYLAQALRCAVIAADVVEQNSARQRFLQPVSDRVRCCRLDVSDRAAFRSLVETEGITHIVHAAAITPDLERERSQASLVVDVNLGGAVNAVCVGYETPQVERVLICSSSGVYGASTAQADLQLENGALQLDNLYAITKFSAEALAERFAQLGPTQMASVRLGSVYGPFEQPGGSRPHVSQVQRLADACRAGRSLRLYGPHISRDWVYTADVAEAIRALLCAPAWNHPVYNIGSGRAIPFQEVVTAFVKRGLRVDWVDEAAEADMAMLASGGRAALSIERLQADTGFAPRFDFEASIADYFDPTEPGISEG